MVGEVVHNKTLLDRNKQILRVALGEAEIDDGEMFIDSVLA